MQLPLPVTLPNDETFKSFVEAKNTELVGLLKNIANGVPDWQANEGLKTVRRLRIPMVNIIGSPGRGKSHLLYAVCHQLARRNVSHSYLNLDEAADWPPNAFEGLESLSLICLDNIQSIAGNARWEEALFDLINRVLEVNQGLLVCTSELGPSHPDFVLPDLRSRLGWGVTYQLQALSDEHRKQVIRKRAQQRGLKLSEQALQFLLHHSDRDLPSLMSLLERLDNRSLQEQKKLSVAMVKRELDLG
ncbi:DnaA regulatory inactivator Hda [Alteromonas aestuariivivens]|uniref:DnaA regulatory inactivator Hda n=1 Tax=Alteromonas aestuariivivens TaxID=1938339 RepID=A0A3D8MAT4_9ALTE|nr:DnaA regulatory inactivator Hda [Alteromonas aestuariivivens]RDV27327.1 DnaA regulatory inactivator Hda [Alteromonas aestuariivivens]